MVYLKIDNIGDVAFNYKIAVAAAERGIDKIRINPGNIGGEDRVKAVVDVCKERNIPIRIGVNGGSLEKEMLRSAITAVSHIIYIKACLNKLEE